MIDNAKEDRVFLAHSNPRHRDDLALWEPLTGGQGHINRVTRRALRFARAAFRHLPALRVLGYSAGRWHDLGKFSGAFQQYLRGAASDSHGGESTGKVDHSSAGAQHAMFALPPPLNAMVAYCIAGHHAGLLEGNTGQAGCLQHRLLKAVPPWRDAAPEALLQAPKGDRDQALRQLIPGNRGEIAFQLGFATRMLFSCLVDADFLATESFMNPEQAAERPKGKTDFRALDTHLGRWMEGRFASPGGKVAKARAEILVACPEKAEGRPGLYLLTVTTSSPVIRPRPPSCPSAPSARAASPTSNSTLRKKGRFDTQGRYVLTFPYSNENEPLMDILRHGPEVELTAGDAWAWLSHSTFSLAEFDLVRIARRSATTPLLRSTAWS